MYRNQIDLLEFGINKNKGFLESLYSSELEKAHKWFSKLDCNALARQRDEAMTLGKFLASMDKGIVHAKLLIGSPDFRDIRHAVLLREPCEMNKDSWVECPYTTKNYNTVSHIFSETFGQSMEAIEIPECLREYHIRMERDYDRNNHLI
jgi:hypothetical protein